MTFSNAWMKFSQKFHMTLLDMNEENNYIFHDENMVGTTFDGIPLNIRNFENWRSCHSSLPQFKDCCYSKDLSNAPKPIQAGALECLANDQMNTTTHLLSSGRVSMEGESLVPVINSNTKAQGGHMVGKPMKSLVAKPPSSSQ
jgi:hypothetical protein